MKRVVQVDDKGCGIACIAMLADISYKKVRKRIFGKRRVVPTNTKAIRKALRKFGITSSKKLIRSTRAQHYTNLQQDALLRVKLPKRDAPNWHWIVWDARRQRFFDPGEDPYVKPPVTSFLTINRLPKSKKPTAIIDKFTS